MYDDYIERHIPHGRKHIPYIWEYGEYENADKIENVVDSVGYINNVSENIYNYDTENIVGARYDAKNNIYRENNVQSESNIYKNIDDMYNSIYNIREKGGDVLSYHNSRYEDTYIQNSTYTDGNLYENQFYKYGNNNSEEYYYSNYNRGVVNNSYKDIVSSQVKDSITNNVSNDGRSVNISLGGITQNFSGSNSGEDIVQEICTYLEQALGTMAEGVHF